MMASARAAGRRFVLELVQRGDARRVHRIEPPPEHRLDQRVLGAEVVVDRGEVDAGLAR